MAVREETGQTGEELWNKIFYWVANLNPRAGSLTRETLPAEWQKLSLSVSAHFESGAIHRLLDHSRDLLQRIRNSIGPKNLHLTRSPLIASLGKRFESEQFTFITGAAGVGKSAAAYDVLREILSGAPLFVFQAGEFARDSLDHALSDLRITEPLSRISALFALHRRKFILIESVERLLEASDREAFFQLLRRLSEDSSWRIILTCRQHAASMVHEAFLRPCDIVCTECQIPVLSNEELDGLLINMPQLQGVVSDQRTRKLLRVPWFLDKASSVDWSKEATEGPLDPHGLRDILWRQIVSRDDQRTNGIHIQRENCFRDIALRRARSLRSFVKIAPGEESASQALIRDELLVVEPSTNFVAPAHDVLEDWALVRWISHQFHELALEPRRFFNSLGQELPIRRSYRMWLQERLGAGDIGEIRAFVIQSYSTQKSKLTGRTRL